MHLSPPVALVAVRSKAVVLSLLIRSWLSLRLWDSVIVQCFVVSYFVSILVVLQSSRGEERAEARSTMRALSGAHSTDVRLNTLRIKIGTRTTSARERSHCWTRIWLLCLACLPGFSWLLCRSSSRCHRFVCSLWLWYFLIILTYYFYTLLVVNICCDGTCPVLWS